MDSQRFDDLARRFAFGFSSRRSVVKALVGGVSGGLLITVGFGRAGKVAAAGCSSDAECPDTNPSCVNGRCRSAACPAGSDFCQAEVTGCGSGCGCATDINGAAFCANSVGCVACTSDGDCEAIEFFGAGSACVVATGPLCDCPGGRGCARACPGSLPDLCADVTCTGCDVCDPNTGDCVDGCAPCLVCNPELELCDDDCRTGNDCCGQYETCNQATGICEFIDLCAGDCAACEICESFEGGGAGCVDACGTCGVCNLDTGICDPRCTDDPETCCDTGETCNPETGACEPAAGACEDDGDCGPCEVCTGGICDPQCGEEEVCNEETGDCEAAAECANQFDCNPCYGCFDGVCVWLCGEACSACDEASGSHGTCLFDCRAGEGNSCCNNGQVCSQQTGQCELDQSQFGSLVIKKVDDEGKPLTGACFDLLNVQTGEVLTSQPHCDGGFGDFDGAANGTVLFQNNVRGIFAVRESVVPDGYEGADDQVTPDIGAGEMVTITFINTPRAATGGEEEAEEESPSTALPSTGVGRPDTGAASWLTGAVFLGAAAALLGGKKLREGATDEDEA